MKNRLILVVVVLVAVVAAALAALPYWFGMQAESAYQAMVQKMTASGEFNVTSNNFQRGWLESTADTTFTLADMPLVTITVLHRISHGPLPLDDDFQFMPLLARVKSQISISLPGGTLKLPTLTGKSTIYLAGNSHTHLEMGPYKSAPAKTDDAGNAVEIDWKGMSGDFDMTADYKGLKGQMNAPQLQFAFRNGSFALNRLGVNMDTQESASGLGTGTVALSVDKLLLDDRSKGEKIAIDGLRVSSSSQEAGGNLNSTLTLQSGGMEVGGSKQGAAQLTVQVRKLDVATLVRFQKEIRELRKKKVPPEQANMMIVGKSLELLGNLAKKSPELEITRLNFKTADGEVTGKAKFVLDGSQLDVSGNPMLMLKALSGEGEISLPDSVVRLLAEPDVKRDIETLKTSGKLTDAEIARLTPQRIAAITSQAIQELPQYRDTVISRLKLVPDGPNYKIVAALKNGQMQVNSQPVQLP